MTEKGRNIEALKAQRTSAPRRTTRPGEDMDVLVTRLGGGHLDFSAMLAIADVLPVMIGYIDDKLTLQFANHPFAEWLEVPRADLVGRKIIDLIGEERHQQREPNYRRALSGERLFFVSQFDHPTRGNVALQSDYVPWADVEGRIQGFLVIHQDVTEQRTAERALRESEERFRRIANSAPALMWVTRIDRVRDFVNETYAEFACGPGCDLEHARTLDWRERIHPDDVERIVAESIAGEASLRPFTLEGRYKRYDGEYRWLRTVSQPRFGPDSELIGFIGVGTDITVAKEAELELRRQVEEQTGQLAASEAQFRAVFEAALEVMVLLKPDGTVLAVNNRREAWRHQNPAAAVGRKLWEAPTVGAYPQHVPVMKKAIAEPARGKVFTAEVKMEREGVPTAYLDVSVQPVRS